MVLTQVEFPPQLKLLLEPRLSHPKLLAQSSWIQLASLISMRAVDGKFFAMSSMLLVAQVPVRPCLPLPLPPVVIPLTTEIMIKSGISPKLRTLLQHLLLEKILQALL